MRRGWEGRLERIGVGSFLDTGEIQTAGSMVKGGDSLHDPMHYVQLFFVHLKKV